MNKPTQAPAQEPQTLSDMLRKAILDKIESGTPKKLIAANAYPCQPNALHGFDEFLAGQKAISLPVAERILDALRLSVVIRPNRKAK